MRSTLLLISYSFILSASPTFAMKALFHFLDKNYVDPINYVTEARSSDLCERLLSLNPSSATSRPFTQDQTTLDEIHQSLEREAKILYIVEEAIGEKDSHTPIEQVLRAAHPAYYSPNALAIMYGYLTTKIKISEETAAKLKKAQETSSSPLAVDAKISAITLSSSASKEPMADVTAHDLSPSALEQLILESNPTWTMKLANLVRKSIINPTGYLTDSKSAIVSEAALFFHPDHAQKKDFNRSIPLHKALLHNAFERQIRLHTLVEYSLRNNDHQTMLTLYQKVRRGYFSKTLEAVFAGYLKYAAQRSTIDTAIRLANAENARKDSETKADSLKDSSLLPPPAIIIENPPAQIDKSKEESSVGVGKNPPHRPLPPAPAQKPKGTTP